ncbi:RagB/SusD family nutrient uptake outer membrane protein [Neolewinella agarilytica]|uniref:Starch-binding associating with outer membrane n=1 Tax=Neolewinella agarilytica TaxID=478744 RepID=A0A1H9GT91_9BACT|nr:RagB/SusD family nutrient uptake outer membrane protein [Neolewinella agarilytica]SEQ53209.1 Starch-binding associating with outer membrane [Neolewinella agarilytica]
MKHLISRILLLLIVVFSSAACNDEVLDTVARDAFGEDLIYSDPNQVERLVFTAYNSTESWAINRFQWWGRRFNIEAGSYEAKFNFRDLDLFRLRAGWTPGNSGIFNQKWSNYWSYVRRTNEFLDRIDDSEAMALNPEKVNVLKGEMKFLRANLYSKLIKYYGGVPILDRALGLDDNFDLVRDSYEDCVAFIVRELDEAADLLPVTRPDSEFGRATKLAAMAVKARTLLYAASSLHDPSTVPNGPLFDYAVPTKWQDAADAAKDVIDLVGDRDLIPVADATEYQKLFLSPNQDILFARPYNSEFYEFGTDANSLWDQTQSPNGYTGWALSSPTHNFAMEFNMANGETTQTGNYDPTQPNENREMRYYANLLFNDAPFRGRPVEYFLSEDVNVAPHGVDSPEGLGNTLHSSKTGYNIRKFQDENVPVAGGISSQRPYILYRLAEIYLNYAEAQFHLGNEVLAREYVNRVSTRALQPEIEASGDDLLEAIRRERRVELSFEGHNFFDERRWMIENHLGFDVRGLRWTRKIDGTYSNEEYTVVTRPFFERHYHLPIPLSEIEKAPSLEQNPGY